MLCHGCCFLGFIATELPEGDTCEPQHPFRVGGKGLEGWRRTSKGVLSPRVEPGASPFIGDSSLKIGRCKSVEESRRLA